MIVLSLIFLILLLFLSASYSGAETAYFSLSKVSLRELTSRYKDSKQIKRLLKDPHSLLITILIGNMIVNVCFSSIATEMLVPLLKEEGLMLSIITVTFLLLIFGEITPKSIAFKNPYKFSLFSSKFLLFSFYVFYPMRVLLKSLTDIFLNFVKKKKKEVTLTEDELDVLIEIGEKEKILDKKEREMISSLLEFTETEVSQIMTPRIDIHAASIDMSQSDFLQFLKKVRFSKIPIYEGSLDKIIGIVHAKDVFLNPQKRFTEFIKEPIFVPESMKIDGLLKELYSKNERMAIVVDEYGGTAGLVTLEDILEEIFGEIYDEFEFPKTLIKKIDENTYLVSGKTSIKEINQKLKLNLPEEEFDTIAGLVLDALGRIPKTGEKLKCKNIEIEIEKATLKRIVSIIIKKV